MKPCRILALATLGIALTYSSNSYALSVTEPNTELKIEFENSDNYSDTSTGFGREEASTALITKSLGATFQKAANKYLPSGYSLTIKVTDIDLAGDRSMISSTYGDIRVYRDIYPPRIAFSYVIQDEQENIVASGDVRKTDLAYTYQLWGARLQPEQEAPFVNELVRGWASNELRRVVTKP